MLQSREGEAKANETHLNIVIEKANDDVVKMEMSPNSEGRPVKMVDEGEPLVDSTASDSNLITSIEVIPSQSAVKDGSSLVKMDKPQDERREQQHSIKDSDLSAQGASGSGQSTTKRESAHGLTNVRDQEGYSIDRGTVSKQDKLVKQMSSHDGSKKSQKGEISGNGSGSNEQNRAQHFNECSSLQSGAYQQSSQPKQIIESSVPVDRRCRLCWCCCCPCSA